MLHAPSKSARPRSTHAKAASPISASVSIPAPINTHRDDGGIDLRLPPVLTRTLRVSYLPPRQTAYGLTDPTYSAALHVNGVSVAFATDSRARITHGYHGQPLLWIGGCAIDITADVVPVILETFAPGGLQPPRPAAEVAHG